jgi:hydrogenase maturation protein HypF
LACGAELKNTFCLLHQRQAFMSHHIGDLENVETLQAFTEGIAHFQNLLRLRPQVVAYDLHPEYLSTKYALALDDGSAATGVQHHTRTWPAAWRTTVWTARSSGSAWTV